MADPIYYPPVGFYFKLSITGVSNASDAGFQEVSGITAELGIEEIAEGGENRFKYRVPDRAKYSNLVVKRGLVVKNSALAQWCLTTIPGDFSAQITTKTVTVVLMDPNGNNLMAWDFINAWPVKWSVSDFKSTDDSVVVESIEFAYSYFTQQK